MKLNQLQDENQPFYVQRYVLCRRASMEVGSQVGSTLKPA